jgi:hypothetical protein
LHGVQESFHRNGKKWAIESYFHGSRHGRMSWYHANGQLEDECWYLNDVSVTKDSFLQNANDAESGIDRSRLWSLIRAEMKAHRWPGYDPDIIAIFMEKYKEELIEVLKADHMSVDLRCPQCENDFSVTLTRNK